MRQFTFQLGWNFILLNIFSQEFCDHIELAKHICFLYKFWWNGKVQPFFNKAICSVFNRQSDKFVIITSVCIGSDLFLVKSHNSFLCVSTVFFSAFFTFLCISLYITNQVIPSNLDLIYWIFVLNSASKILKCLLVTWILPSSSSDLVLSADHLLQQLYQHSQHLEQDDCQFEHLHDIILHFDAKRVKYILNWLHLHFSNICYLTQLRSVSCVIFDISASKNASRSYEIIAVN